MHRDQKNDQLATALDRLRSHSPESPFTHKVRVEYLLRSPVRCDDLRACACARVDNGW